MTPFSDCLSASSS